MHGEVARAYYQGMAQNVMFTYPLDQPRLIRPGVTQRETEFHGAAKWGTLPPEHPERAAKGDLSQGVIPFFESRHSVESPGLPYKNLRNGRK